MTVTLETSIHRYIGLSSDDKPTGVPVGSTFLCHDTDEVYVTHDGTTWVLRDTLIRLVAGTVAIGKLAANSGVDIGDVDVASIAAGTNNIGDVDEAAIACAAADIHAPAANTAAVVTYAATAGVKHCVTGIAWSYVGGLPTGGNLKVEDVSGTTVFTMDISDQGAGIIVFPKPKKSAAVNTAMIVTLAAGGAGVTGKVSVLNKWTEA